MGYIREKVLGKRDLGNFLTPFKKRTIFVRGRIRIQLLSEVLR